MWNERQSPELAKRLSVMEKARDLIHTNGTLVIAQIELAMGGKGSWVRVQRSRELHNAADDALKLA